MNLIHLLLLLIASSFAFALKPQVKVHHNLPPSKVADESQTIRVVGTASGSLFLDELGRSRVFRGTNVVFKAFPFVPDIRPEALPRWSFNQDDVNILKDHATTAIRLGVMWPGVEPERGHYNMTYLETLKSIVQMCDEAGIYVLLDFHEDVFSEKFCGEGVPLWAAQPKSGRFGFPFPLEVKAYPVDDDGIPSREDCYKHSHALYHGTQAASEAFQRLYDNYDNLRDSFISYWKLVAETFLPFKNILGYDLINEPWNGNVFKDPSLSNAQVANRKNLQPFYELVAAGIRSVDPFALIHFEPVTTVQKSVGFDRTPGGPDLASKDVLNFHYYASVNKQFDVDETIGFRVEQAEALGAGSFLSEFEMGWIEGRNIENIRFTAQSADRRFLSYTGWEYTDYVMITATNNGIRDPETGKIRRDMATVYSRPYANAVAGQPLLMEYLDDSGNFTLKYIYNGMQGQAGATEIRTNFALHYPDGFSLTVKTASGSKFLTKTESVNGIIFVTPHESEFEHPEIGEEVTVILERV